MCPFLDSLGVWVPEAPEVPEVPEPLSMRLRFRV